MFCLACIPDSMTLGQLLETGGSLLLFSFFFFFDIPFAKNFYIRVNTFHLSSYFIHLPTTDHVCDEPQSFPNNLI